LELEEAQKITNRLTKRLNDRRPTVSKYLSYFKGNTGSLRFASDKFGQYFDKRFQGFSDNWCMPVVQAPAERMTFLGIRPYGSEKGVDKELERAWMANDGDRGSSEAFLVFSAAARSFALVSPTDDPTTPRLTWEHPESAIVDYDPFTGHPRYGVLTWIDDDKDFATLYTDTEMWRFQRDRQAADADETAPGDVNLWGGWAPRDPDNPMAPNPLGEMPLTELQNQTLLDDEPISDIAGVAVMQDTINLIWAYLLNGLDTASLPGRVVTGADVPQVPVLDSAGQVSGYRMVELDELIKERIMFLPGEQAKIAEWSAGQLDVFSLVIEKAVEHVAAQTRTPPHYLVAKMVNTAAESLNIAEAGLVSKTGERITYVNAPLKRISRLMAKAQGADQKRLTAISSGTPIWNDIQYRSESQLADAVGKWKAAGFPFEYIAEKVCRTPEEVRRVMAMKKKELAMDPLLQAQALQQNGV
jgi:hypothetical protein